MCVVFVLRKKKQHEMCLKSNGKIAKYCKNCGYIGIEKARIKRKEIDREIDLLLNKKNIMDRVVLEISKEDGVVDYFRCDLSKVFENKKRIKKTMERARVTRFPKDKCIIYGCNVNRFETIAINCDIKNENLGINCRSVTAKDLVDIHIRQRGMCYYTGLKYRDDVYVRDKFRMTLDRIVPSVGYTRENVVFCCWFVNCAKNMWNIEEMMDVWRFLPVKCE